MVYHFLLSHKARCFNSTVSDAGEVETAPKMQYMYNTINTLTFSLPLTVMKSLSSPLSLLGH